VAVPLTHKSILKPASFPLEFVTLSLGQKEIIYAPDFSIVYFYSACPDTTTGHTTVSVEAKYLSFL
jgi:hypothetical protein